MKHFLLDYDRPRRELVSIKAFEDAEEALAAYSEREAETLGTTHEVVLLGANCEDDLRRTHSRYFVEFDTSGRFLSNGKKRQETVNRVSKYAEELARKGIG